MTPPSAHLAPAEQRLSQRVLGRLRGLRLTDGGTVAVGFSGGPDSLCLALVLAKLAPVAGIRAVLVHVDHGLRPSSAEQARQAAVLAEAVALPFRVVRLEPGLRERHPGVGIEEAARRERLLALATEAERVGAEVVALAHHLEDQAETTLLHLLRGAGLAGARGMASTTTMLLPWWNAPELTPMTLRLWRPLLQEPKAALDGCLRASGLAAVRDESNDDAAFRRNWLRAEIIPALRRGDPGAEAALARFGGVASGEDVFLNQLAAERAADCVGGDGSLDLARFATAPEALRGRVVRIWVGRAQPGLALTWNRTTALAAFLAAGRADKTLEIAAGVSAFVDGTHAFVGRRRDVEERLRGTFAGPLWEDEDQSIPVAGRGLLRVGRHVVRFESVAGSRLGDLKEGGCLPGVRASLRVGGRIRPAAPGDRYATSGVRVGDWARRAGIHPLLRPRLVCIAGGDGVACVLGLPQPPGKTGGIDEVLVSVFEDREEARR